LHLWRPIEQDLCIVSHWLLECPPSSVENQLARQILSQLNWGCEGPGVHGGVLALPLELHQRVAILVVEAALRFVPETAAAGVITESVKQVRSRENVNVCLYYCVKSKKSKLSYPCNRP
jgi:hypothetical protein